MKWKLYKKYAEDGTLYWVAETPIKTYKESEAMRKTYRRLKRGRWINYLSNFGGFIWGDNGKFEIEIRYQYNDVTKPEALTLLKDFQLIYQEIKNAENLVEEIELNNEDIANES